jgi:hypothetical protein
MSWSINAMPAGIAAAHDLLDAPVRDDEPIPHVGDVLGAIRDSGCRGSAWFEVDGVNVGEWLPEWDPDHQDDYLGEVTINPSEDRLTLTTPVEFISFRKPSAEATLVMICELARASGGSVMVFDNELSVRRIVRPGDRPADHAHHWPA